MTRTELWDRPSSMVIWSKRRTQLQIWGRDSADTRLGVGGRLVGTETVSVVSSAESTPDAMAGENAAPPSHEAIARLRNSPKKRRNFRFIFCSPLQYSA